MSAKISKKSLEQQMKKEAEEHGLIPVHDVLYNPNPDCDRIRYSSFQKGWQAVINYLEKEKKIKLVD